MAYRYPGNVRGFYVFHWDIAIHFPEMNAHARKIVFILLNFNKKHEFIR